MPAWGWTFTHMSQFGCSFHEVTHGLVHRCFMGLRFKLWAGHRWSRSSSTASFTLVLLLCFVQGRRARMLSRRRRQNLLVICLLSGMGACVYADIRVRRTQAAAYGSPTSRKLLNVIVHVSDLVLSHLHNTTRVTVKHVSEQVCMNKHLKGFAKHWSALMKLWFWE